MELLQHQPLVLAWPLYSALFPGRTALSNQPVSLQGMADKEKQEGSMCHLFQGTVGLGQSGPFSGGVAEAHPAQGSQMSHQHSSARWGWWGGLGLVSGSCRLNQAPSVSGLVLELEPFGVG